MLVCGLADKMVCKLTDKCLWHSRELNNVFGDGNMNFDKFKDEHSCNKFCSYYGLQPFSSESESGLKDPTSACLPSESKGAGSSFPKNSTGFDPAWKGKGKAKVDDDDPSWEGKGKDKADNNADDIVDVDHWHWQKGKDRYAASTSAAGGYTKGMDLSP